MMGGSPCRAQSLVRVASSVSLRRGGGHRGEDGPILLESRLEQRDERLLLLHETGESVARCGRHHHAHVVASHREGPISGHAAGGVAQLAGEASVRARELAIGFVLALRIFVGKIKGLHVHFEDTCRRRDELAEAGGERRVLGEAFAAGLFFVHFEP
jgi:hypothetical protein